MNRPKLDLPWTATDKMLEVVALVGWLGTIILVAMQWNVLPDRIPQHYNFAGEIDAYGSREALLLLPLVGSLLWIGTTVLGRYPHIYNYVVRITEQNAARQYLAARRLIIFLKAMIGVLFLGITWHIIDTSLGTTYSILPIIAIPVGLILIGSVAYLVISLRER